jgi:hypothetical protein
MAGYHSPADTPDRVAPATLHAVARLVVATVWFIAGSAAKISSLVDDGRSAAGSGQGGRYAR